MDQTKANLPSLDWGYLPLWNIAFVTTSSAAIIWLVTYDYELYIVLASLVGIIAGIVIGLTPWLAYQRRISEVGWWICTITALFVMLIALVFMNSLPFIDGIYWTIRGFVILWIIPVAIESLIVTSIIRRVCEQSLKSEAGWRAWTLAGTKVFGVFIVTFILCFILWML